MEKKKKIPGWARILILAAVLAVGLGIWTGLKAYNEKQEEENTSGMTMLSVKNAKVRSFTYELDGAVYTFTRENSKSDWVYQQDPSLELDQDTVTGVLSVATNVSTEKIVADNSDRAAEFGLDDPSFTVTMVLEDGSQKTVYLGSVNPMTSDYYASVEGDGRIFTLNQDFYRSFTSAEELAAASSEMDLSDSVY